MYRPAINDLLGSILCRWCESAAEWMPPGQLFATTCTTCRVTLLDDLIDVAVWPHDLMHQLCAELDGAIETVAELQAGDAARAQVRAYVAARAADLIDVLEECVAPRLDEWISSQTMSLSSHLRG